MSDGEEEVELAVAVVVSTPQPPVFTDPRDLSLEEQYHAIKTVGEGPWGVMKHCVDRYTGETYALKSIEKTKSDQPFPTSQVALLKYLNHPNLVRVKNIYDTDSNWHIVQELVTGRNILSWIANRESYSEKDIAEIMKQLLEALQYLHENGIMHRNLKFNNILVADPTLASSLTVKLSDAGLAFFVGDNLHREICNHNPAYLGSISQPWRKLSPRLRDKSWGKRPGYTRLYTTLYLAPEVLLGKKWGKAVDMWACGVILYILLTGCEPFGDSRGKQEEFERILHSRYFTDTDEWKQISQEAQDLVEKLLEVDSEKRWTVEQTLAHKWMQGRDTDSAYLQTAHSRLKERGYAVTCTSIHKLE